MNILHIETATPVCSVALSINGMLATYKDHHEANIHASKLTVFIQEILDDAKLEIGDLHAVAVSKGPGSYTGLRIGVSVAKGICYALDIPLISIHTLNAMAAGFLAEHTERYAADTLFCPMIDARRMEVYTAIFDRNTDVIRAVAARIIDSTSFDEFVEKHPIVLFGEGADKFVTVFEDKLSIHIYQGFLNSARFLVEEASLRYQKKQFEDLAYFEPFYLKDFVPTTPKKLVQS